MPDRRRFLKTLALAPLAPWAPAFAEGAAAGVALVIGNNAYAQTPLQNPVNDAQAMAGLLGRAGFAVDIRTDAGFDTMNDAVTAFGAAIRRSPGRLVVFYYAGHGAQVDWRNYLLPVDARIRSADDLKTRCLDMGSLLQQLAATRDKTFLIILDACRDNPFGADYRTDQKGLSQFDAPVGTLLAYATAPGNVALDGEGSNGLYTQNLVRELATPGARIEDCLKRVRLNVRLASQGLQIPWESTSLEQDVILFPTGAGKPGEEELERQFEEELATWARIKASKKIDDWVGYLRAYPNGRFSEVAQARLSRLLEAIERRRPTPIRAAATIELGPGLQVEPLFLPPDNPHSAGTHPLGRHFRLGDQAVYRQSDLLTGVAEGERRIVVTRVDADNDLVEYNNGASVSDLLGNLIHTPQRTFAGPMQLTPAELQLGKRWVARMASTSRTGRAQEVEFEVKVAALEKVAVPAGEFHAFRIEARGWNYGANASLERRLWIVPGLNFPVKSERIAKRRGRFVETEREELLSLRQGT